MTQSKGQICPMTLRHIPELAQLEQQCFSLPWTAAQLAEELANPSAVFLVAELEGKVVGYGGMLVAADEGAVTNIAVFPAYRGRGFGKALTAALLEEACRRGLALVALEVRESNAVAIALYQSLGFVEAGRRKAFYEKPREDAKILLWQRKETRE